MKVVHCKKEPYDVYIGRFSIFDNPSVIGIDGNRDEVLKKYQKYFQNRIANDVNFRKKILELNGKTLGCWCKPKTCHGDIIIDWLKNYYSSKEGI